MSTTDNFPYSVVQQKELICADLNSTLLFQFLFVLTARLPGIYTGVFSATIYIYIHKENRTLARDRIIIGSITALFFLTALNAVMNWLYTNILFGTHGATRFKMFLESVSQDVPLGEQIIADLMGFVSYVLADGLLVWRCFHLCGGSFRKALLPIALLTVETEFQTLQNIEVSSRLNAATLVADSQWQQPIWRHTTLSSRSRRRYQTIINALIESSALYTATAIFEAILDFTTTGNIESSLEVFLILDFVDGASQIGLAPTLMIALLFVSSSQGDTEVSSACLPSDLISRASHPTGVNMTNLGADLEMQERGSIGVGKQESEEIGVITRAEYHMSLVRQH
ncbi:hypothetical protein CPC08DRAFT_730415 [Agrocybe pediades]|nr:hypothetical protein CPC08DRAFT_730415 [Agrocybe pediades]